MWLTLVLQSVFQFDLIRLPLPAQQETVNDFHMQHMINGDRQYCLCRPACIHAGKLWNVANVLRSQICLLLPIHTTVVIFSMLQ